MKVHYIQLQIDLMFMQEFKSVAKCAGALILDVFPLSGNQTETVSGEHEFICMKKKITTSSNI